MITTDAKAAPASVSSAQMANAIRVLAMDAVEAAKSGHPGMPMGMADVATVLYGDFLKHDPSWPDWPDRDRFVLSAGHGSMLLYALLYLNGYPDIDIGQIRNFRQLGSLTAGHPEYGHAAGIETTTGPLGQGLANAVGMALAERITADRFGAELPTSSCGASSSTSCPAASCASATSGCSPTDIARQSLNAAGRSSPLRHRPRSQPRVSPRW